MYDRDHSAQWAAESAAGSAERVTSAVKRLWGSGHNGAIPKQTALAEVLAGELEVHGHTDHAADRILEGLRELQREVALEVVALGGDPDERKPPIFVAQTGQLRGLYFNAKE